MQSVVETPDYSADARKAGLSDLERRTIVDLIAADPTAGDLIKGTGGARKVRVAGRGKGKSGGYRIVTYFGGDDIPRVPARGVQQGRQGRPDSGGAERVEDRTCGSCRRLP